jgi:hypothetical protein
MGPQAACTTSEKLREEGGTTLVKWQAGEPDVWGEVVKREHFVLVENLSADAVKASCQGLNDQARRRATGSAMA